MKNTNFYKIVTSVYQSFIYENSKVVGYLGEKYDFVNPFGIQIEINFHSANTRIEVNSFSFKITP